MIKLRPWAERSNTIAIIPGSKVDRREAVVEIVGQLPLRTGQQIEVRRASGGRVSVAVELLGRDQLSRGGLARRDENNCWVASDPLVAWVNDAERDDLAEHLHANTKFFGELLVTIESLHSKKEFLDLALEYGLHWTSTTQLYARVNWMELLGLLERWGSYKFVLTERGKRFLERIQVVEPREAIGHSLVATSMENIELAPPGDEVASLLAGLGGQQLRKRKILIGYVPRGRKAPLDPNRWKQLILV